MKQYTLFCAAFLASATTALAVPNTMNYQGQLFLNGMPTTGPVGITFRMFGTQIGGAELWSETHNVTVTGGLFQTTLGDGTVFPSDIFAAQVPWLEMEVNGAILSPRIQFQSVPYALNTTELWSADGTNVWRPDGNVGIGTATPGERLTIAGSMEIGTNSADYQHLRIGGGNSSGFLYGSYPGLGDGIHIGYNYYWDAAGGQHWINGGGGTSRISMGYGSIDMAASASSPPYNTILHVGLPSYLFTFFGINTTNPQFTLEVNGAAGKPGGGSWSNSSDIRLKRNVEPLTGALDHLLCLHGVTFEYIDPKAINELSGQRIGMIAQEVEEVFPDWVGQRTDGYKTLTYRGFEALTVEALRDLRQEKDGQFHEQEARISALEAENAELKTSNDAVRERLDALESLLGTLADQSRGGVRQWSRQLPVRQGSTSRGTPFGTMVGRSRPASGSSSAGAGESVQNPYRGSPE